MTYGTDLFCAGRLMLSDRTLLLTGGDVYVQSNTTNLGNPDSNVFNPATNQLTSTGTQMNLPRWYGTLTKTHDDRVFKTGSITHSFGLDQALLVLPFIRSGNTISATVPDSGGDLTPGFYMVFVLDTAGVP
ncbi:MAG: galactose oxidase-like domain-containing protein [Burkholderiales bacterium]|jgi:hypothetical protein